MGNFQLYHLFPNLELLKTPITEVTLDRDRDGTETDREREEREEIE